jgi:hypothetical protein
MDKYEYTQVIVKELVKRQPFDWCTIEEEYGTGSLFFHVPDDYMWATPYWEGDEIIPISITDKDFNEHDYVELKLAMTGHMFNEHDYVELKLAMTGHMETDIENYVEMMNDWYNENNQGEK